MHVERMLRVIAGLFVLGSVALAVTVDIHWLWFTGFVGANLLQSGFTGKCPMITLLEKLGVRKCAPGCCED